jgi:predicted PurR-regulated permease PerM
VLRLVSLGMIIGLVVVFGLLSAKVMAGFFLPLLLAAMLAVVSGPLHGWIRDRLGGPEWLVAGATVTCILILVLAPFLVLCVQAGVEAFRVAGGPSGLAFDGDRIGPVVQAVNDATGLKLSAAQVAVELTGLLEDTLGPVAAATPKVLGKVLIGLGVMTVGLYYFLADGRRMIAAVTRLVPLDPRYQWQLLDEFQEVSRAVVSATLLAAVVQATLAGLGFVVAGVGNVFLLTLLTFFFSMVPFVGAAVVWVPVSLYLLAVEKQTWTAAGLAIWGAAVVSTADNIVKPLVLHGRSKLHPLLALLSVLGGVAALGPIGILVGPIAVAFLQSALTMLHTELDRFRETEEPTAGGPSPVGWAAAAGAAAKVAPDDAAG